MTEQVTITDPINLDWLHIGCGRRAAVDNRERESDNALRLRGCQGMETYS